MRSRSSSSPAKCSRAAEARGRALREAAAAAVELRGRGLFLQDLLGAALGLRPAARCLAPRGAGAALRRFCEASGLALRRYRDAAGTAIALIGREPRRLAELERLDLAKGRPDGPGDRDAWGRRIGELLGYPACCRERFDEAFNDRFPRRALEAGGPGPHPFTANFLYNFQSRSYGDGALERLWRAGYDAGDAFLLPWVPCRLDCPESERFGRALYSMLAAFDPDWAGALRERLRAAVLYWDDWHFLALDGAKPCARGWSFRGLRPGASLVPERTREALARGGELRRGRGRWTVLSGGAPARIPAPAALFEFDGR